MQDIDIEDHAEFSDMFLLGGDDEKERRRFLEKKILDLFVQRKGICLECAPGRFIYFRSGKRSRPEGIREYMNQADSIYSVFVERASHSVTNSD